MIAPPQHPPKMTVEEYLQWEAQQEIRYEYVNGEVFAMTGGTIPHPKLIAEVLSPSTSSNDRGDKFTHYLTIPTLQDYLLIDAEKVSVERYSRGEGRMWFYYPYQAGDIITLSSIEFEFPIELLYEAVVFETN